VERLKFWFQQGTVLYALEFSGVGWVGLTGRLRVPKGPRHAAIWRVFLVLGLAPAPSMRGCYTILEAEGVKAESIW
jgi:hypothetical protein